MKFVSVLSLVAICCMACNNKAQPEVKTIDISPEVKAEQADLSANYESVSFQIEGMTCAVGCAKRIESNLAALDGVKEAKVDFETKTAYLVYDVEKHSKADFEATVTETGEAYSVSSWTE